MSNKFNELLDLLVNEENDKAEELFHDIVVEKSRDIYNSLVEQDVEDVKIEEEKHKDKEEKDDEKMSKKDKMKKEGEESDEEAVEETEASEDEAVEETEASEEDAVEETADEADETIEEVGGDATDDLIADIEAEQNGDEMAPEAMHSMNAGDMDPTDNDDAEGSEEEVKDKIMDLENALDELKAEFDAMMGDEDKGEDDKEEADMPDMPEMPGEEVEMEADATEEEAVEETADEEVEEAEKKTAEQLINEYSDMVKADMSGGEDSNKSPVAAKGGTEPSANASDLMDTKEAGAVKSADKPKDMGVDAKNKPGIKKAKMDNAPKPTTADTPDNKTSVTPK